MKTMKIKKGVLLKCETDDSTVVIPAEVTEIGKQAFQKCYFLHHVTFEEGSALKKISEDAFRNSPALRSITLPPTVREIGAHAFEHCKMLEDISIPATVTRIGERAFAFSGIHRVTFAQGSALEKIEEGVFCFCKQLKSINIPASVTEIGEEAFSNCGNVECITVPASVVLIGKRAFYESAIHSVFFEDGSHLTQINDEVFCGAMQLESLTLPACVTEIGKGAAQNCTRLRHVRVCADVTHIGHAAFAFCDNLEEVEFFDVGPQIKTLDVLSQTAKDARDPFDENIFLWCFQLKTVIAPAYMAEAVKRHIPPSCEGCEIIAR